MVAASDRYIMAISPNTSPRLLNNRVNLLSIFAVDMTIDQNTVVLERNVHRNILVRSMVAILCG